MTTNLPNSLEIEDLLRNIEGIIGLGASFPQERFKLVPAPLVSENYQILWNAIDDSLRNLREAGFPFPHQNPHRTLTAMWVWCWTLPGGAAQRMARPRELYAETIGELRVLRDAVSRGVDAPSELLRELRESVRRRNEVFVIMAFRQETEGFWLDVIKPLEQTLSLRPLRIDKEETEVAISEEILSAIRRALIVVCDLSFERPNCYFEAGYAKGCFRRVLFTARRDHDPRATEKGEFKVHFDVDQLKITWWDPSDFPQAKRELEERVRKILAEISEE